MHHRARDLSGQTLGYLTVIKYAGSNGAKSLWELECVCGTRKIIPAIEITKMQKKGVTASCGCKKRETISRKRSTHGMSGHKVFAVWRSMLDRCTLPSHQAWERYGGRGIAVCPEWRASFAAFWADMGPTYREGLTLERKDNSQGYSPDNCVWATRVAQARNTRSNVLVSTPWGEMTAAEAADRAGLNRTTVYYRISRGVPDHRLLEPPCFGRKFTTW